MIYSYTKLKKGSTGAVVSVLMFAIIAACSPISFAPAPKAHAQFGLPQAAFEINPAVVTGVVATGASSVTQTVILQALNGLAWSIAKMTVQSLTRSTVNWINSGFKGSPAFVSDLQGNLRSLGDAVADDFLNHLNQTVVDTTGFNIKSPFQDQLNQQLRAEYYRTTGSWGLNYTLAQQSKDPKAFINGDFSKGGVSAFLSASQNPANNPFGAYRLASNQLWSQVDAAAQQRKAEVNWGKGFLPWRGGCAATPAATPANSPGSTDPKAAAKNAASAPTSLSTAEKCPFNSVRTPGSVIESQLENQLGSGVRQLELADSINEIVGALIGQLVNQVLGAGGLLGASQPSSGGGQSYLSTATDPSQYDTLNSSLANGVTQNIKNDQTNVTTYRDNWQKVLDAANAANKACGVRSDITGAITQATAGVTKGNAALTKISAIQAEVQSASQGTSVTKGTDITTALSHYQSYLSSSDIPNAAEESEATLEAQDTQNSTGLYTQMVNAAKTCGVKSST